tara:strand:+ start:98 stop:217 length:120 start_codon:yes stop_codon:yes gene_type:complete
MNTLAKFENSAGIHSDKNGIWIKEKRAKMEKKILGTHTQ